MVMQVSLFGVARTTARVRMTFLTHFETTEGTKVEGMSYCLISAPLSLGNDGCLTCSLRVFVNVPMEERMKDGDECLSKPA